jgi:hypothetical protein
MSRRTKAYPYLIRSRRALSRTGGCTSRSNGGALSDDIEYALSAPSQTGSNAAADQNYAGPERVCICGAVRKQWHFRSVDEFFDAVIAIFRNHMAALEAYVEMEEAKGYSREEVLSAAEFEIVFTRERR